MSGQQYEININPKEWDTLEMYKIKFDDAYTSEVPLNLFHEQERLSKYLWYQQLEKLSSPVYSYNDLTIRHSFGELYHSSMHEILGGESLDTVADITNINFSSNGWVANCDIVIHTPDWNTRFDKNMVVKYYFKKNIKKQCKEVGYKLILLFYLFLNLFEYYNIYIQWYNIVFDENSSYSNGTDWYNYCCLNMILWSNDNIKDIVFGALLLQTQMHMTKRSKWNGLRKIVFYIRFAYVILLIPSFFDHTLYHGFLFFCV